MQNSDAFSLNRIFAKYSRFHYFEIGENRVNIHNYQSDNHFFKVPIHSYFITFKIKNL